MRALRQSRLSCRHRYISPGADSVKPASREIEIKRRLQARRAEVPQLRVVSEESRKRAIPIIQPQVVSEQPVARPRSHAAGALQMLQQRAAGALHDAFGTPFVQNE